MSWAAHRGWCSQVQFADESRTSLGVEGVRSVSAPRLFFPRGYGRRGVALGRERRRRRDGSPRGNRPRGRSTRGRDILRARRARTFESRRRRACVDRVERRVRVRVALGRSGAGAGGHVVERRVDGAHVGVVRCVRWREDFRERNADVTIFASCGVDGAVCVMDAARVARWRRKSTTRTADDPSISSSGRARSGTTPVGSNTPCSPRGWTASFARGTCDTREDPRAKRRRRLGTTRGRTGRVAVRASRRREGARSAPGDDDGGTRGAVVVEAEDDVSPGVRARGREGTRGGDAGGGFETSVAVLGGGREGGESRRRRVRRHRRLRATEWRRRGMDARARG